MIEYADIVGKKVVLYFNKHEYIPGTIGLDEENFMVQLFPDKKNILQEDGVCLGIGCETFENDIIKKLKKSSRFHKRFKAEYIIKPN